MRRISYKVKLPVCVLIIALLVLAMHTVSLKEGGDTPEDVFRELEESHCFGPSKVLYQYEEGGGHVLIAEYDRWLIASETDRRIVVWQPTGGEILELSETKKGMMVQIRSVYHRNPDGWGPSYIYGKLYDPRIKKVVAAFSDGTTSSQEEFNSRVFFIPYKEEGNDEPGMTEFEAAGIKWIAGYDKDGKELCRYKECNGSYYDGWDLSIEN